MTWVTKGADIRVLVEYTKTGADTCGNSWVVDSSAGFEFQTNSIEIAKRFAVRRRKQLITQYGDPSRQGFGSFSLAIRIVQILEEI